MTDPTRPAAHPTDPVEDRLRRTFAARAEDMAAGDSAGALPDAAHDARPAPPRSTGRRRPLLAAAAVVVVAATTAGIALVSRDGGRPGDDVATVADLPPEVADASPVAASRAVVDALRDERALATAMLMGIDDSIELPLTDVEQTRVVTDAEVTVFGAFVSDSPDGAAHQSGLDGLGALAELRRDIDADTSTRKIDNAPTAHDVFARYSAIVDALLADQEAYAETVDDPDEAAGATAHARGSRLREQTTQLVHATLLAVIVPGSTSVSVSDLAQRRAGVQLGLEGLLAETAGTPDEEAALTVVREVEESGLLEAVDGAVRGDGDLVVILGAGSDLEGESWPSFLDAVEERLAGQT